MKVILTQTLAQVGVIGETKDVKPGFARNYLLPRGLAVLESDGRAKSYRAEYKHAAARLTTQRAVIGELAEQWRGQVFTVTARASDDGTLYGSVGKKEILKLLGREDIELEVPTLKTLGTHQIDLRFVNGSTIPVTILIESESRASSRTKK